MVNKCEPIDLDGPDFPSEDEIEVLLKSLKSGKELLPSVDSLDDYANQVFTEIYLHKILKGNLHFTIFNSVVELEGNTYLRFDDNLRLK